MIQTDNILLENVLTFEERLLKLGQYEFIVVAEDESKHTWKTNITRLHNKLRKKDDGRIFRFKTTKKGAVVVRTV